MRKSLLLLLMMNAKGPSVQAQTGLPIARHVLVIGVDGMSPAGIRAAHTPVMDSLLLTSACTFNAQAVLPTSSGPNWASMLMGAGPDDHGIRSNYWRPDSVFAPLPCEGMDGKGQPSGMWPTVFGELRRQRPESRLACFHDWWNFKFYIEQGVLDKRAQTGLLAKAFHTGHRQMARRAGSYFRRKAPLLTFVHLDQCDHAGHKHGHGSPGYNSSVTEADRLIGRMLRDVQRSGVAEETVVFIVSDHGGIGYGHGGDTPEERTVPWILHGRRVVHGKLEVPVSNTDLAPTILYLLGLQPPTCWTGRPVLQAVPF
jgi:predicted AlkP superfamily pyrophosphatase or phosphodiesterase